MTTFLIVMGVWIVVGFVVAVIVGKVIKYGSGD
jgi:hypothetical protein